jgi:uncharacterized membrane protein
MNALFGQPFVIPAILILVVAVPLILGIIPPNHIYGVRTPKTISNAGVWYRANRAGGWMLLLDSLLYLVIAAFVPNPPPPQDSLPIWLLHLVAFLGPLIVSLVLVQRYIKRL